MSINSDYQISPFIKLKMFDEREKILGLVKDKIQVVIGLPNIADFSNELKKTINTFSKNTECFIITSSEKDSTSKIVDEYNLSKESVSLDFKKFARTFNLANEENNMEKSLMIIDKNCQIVHKDIL